MLKKSITYTDYNGETRTEDKYFNLSKAELAELEIGTEGGYGAMLQNLVASKDVHAMVEVFKSIILKAYGEKTPDGRGFIKKRNGVLLSEEFEQTEAYSELFMELVSNEEAATEFIRGVLPVDIQNQIDANGNIAIEKAINPSIPAPPVKKSGK